jgi:hypothetical protein
MQNRRGQLSISIEVTIFCQKYDRFNAKPNYKKSSTPFQPYLINRPKVRPQIFPAPHNLFCTLLCFADEISAPWQQWSPLFSEIHYLLSSSKPAFQQPLLLKTTAFKYSYLRTLFWTNILSTRIISRGSKITIKITGLHKKYHKEGTASRYFKYIFIILLYSLFVKTAPDRIIFKLKLFKFSPLHNPMPNTHFSNQNISLKIRFIKAFC